MRLLKIMIDVIVLVMKKFAKKIIVFLLVLAMLCCEYICKGGNTL